jgi:hypothetical protein
MLAFFDRLPPQGAPPAVPWNYFSFVTLRHLREGMTDASPPKKKMVKRGRAVANAAGAKFGTLNTKQNPAVNNHDQK